MPITKQQWHFVCQKTPYFCPFKNTPSFIYRAKVVALTTWKYWKGHQLVHRNFTWLEVTWVLRKSLGPIRLCPFIGSLIAATPTPLWQATYDTNHDHVMNQNITLSLSLKPRTLAFLPLHRHRIVQLGNRNFDLLLIFQSIKRPPWTIRPVLWLVEKEAKGGISSVRRCTNMNADVLGFLFMVLNIE